MSLADQLPPFPEPPLTVAVSECLIGGEVRYDGGHKRSSLPHDRLEGLFSFRPICPEVGIGLGVPRDVIRLVGPVQAPRAQSAAEDATDRLASYAREQLPVLDDVDGYVFMKGSPSCGLFRVKVYANASAAPSYDGRGIYAGEIVRARPELPVEESGRLFDAVLRENFVTRTFVHAHWRKLRDAGVTAKRLIAFHSAYKFLVMAHSVSSYQSVGRLLADLSGDLEAIAARYFSALMQSLATPASRGGHANALAHLQGYVKRAIPSRSRQELAALIESYRRGEVPLLAPLSLLKHHLVEHAAIYALSQLYLQPHPPSAALRREL
jgi:uncharacterized protein YbgA (DUF1722 family)/uncharacterized protein YbbK (DUF523 family)